MDRPQESIKSLYSQFIEKFGHEVKNREGNNIRVICPLCFHKSLSCNIQNGLIHCFHCGYGKGIKFAGAASGYIERPINTPLQKEISLKLLEISTLHPIHKTYLAKRGIYHPEKYGIVTVPLRADKLLLKYYSEAELIDAGYFFSSADGYGVSKAIARNRLLIPFWQGDKIIGLKSRLHPYADPLDEEPRYICVRGTKIKDKLWYKGDLGPDVIITEGELCAIATNEIGISAVGIPGIAQIATSELQAELKRVFSNPNIKRTFIILDTDPGIENDPKKLQHAVTLYKTIPNSCIVYLPSNNPAEKIDLDSYLITHPLEDLTYLMEQIWKKRKEYTIGLINRINRLNRLQSEGRN